MGFLLNPKDGLGVSGKCLRGSICASVGFENGLVCERRPWRAFKGQCVASEEAMLEVRSRHVFFSCAKCRNRTNVQSECAGVSESDRERQMSAISAICLGFVCVLLTMSPSTLFVSFSECARVVMDSCV